MIKDFGTWNEHIAKTQDNHREIYGVDMIELASTYHTPLFVLFEGIIEHNYLQYKKTLDILYNNNLVCYAVKANSTFDVINLLATLGAGVDVASEFEMQFALDAGIVPEKIRANGNCKSEYYLTECIQKGIIINVDPEEELEIIQSIAEELGVLARINLRLAGFPLKHITSTAISTSSEWSKFGINVNKAGEIFERVLDMDNVIPNGLMVHLGSQITDIQAYYKVLDILINLSKEALSIGFDISEIDLGGGLGIQYFQQDEWNSIQLKIKNTKTENYTWADELIGYEYNPEIHDFEWIGEELSLAYTPDSFIMALLNARYSSPQTFKEKLDEIGTPRLVIEPGRSLVGNAGVTIATIGRISHTPHGHNMVHVDAGVNSHTFGMVVPEQLHRIEIANNIEKGELFETYVAGNLCFTGDLFCKVKNKLVRKPDRGDCLLFYDTGAYSDFFASNANSFPRCAKVMVAKDGTHRLLVKREDMFEVFHREVDWESKIPVYELHR